MADFISKEQIEVFKKENPKGVTPKESELLKARILHFHEEISSDSTVEINELDGVFNVDLTINPSLINPKAILILLKKGKEKLFYLSGVYDFENRISEEILRHRHGFFGKLASEELGSKFRTNLVFNVILKSKEGRVIPDLRSFSFALKDRKREKRVNYEILLKALEYYPVDIDVVINDFENSTGYFSLQAPPEVPPIDKPVESEVKKETPPKTTDEILKGVISTLTYRFDYLEKSTDKKWDRPEIYLIRGCNPDGLVSRLRVEKGGYVLIVDLFVFGTEINIKLNTEEEEVCEIARTLYKRFVTEKSELDKIIGLIADEKIDLSSDGQFEVLVSLKLKEGDGVLVKFISAKDINSLSDTKLSKIKGFSFFSKNINNIITENIDNIITELSEVEKGVEGESAPEEEEAV